MSSAQESSYSGRRNIPLDHEFDQSADHEFASKVLFWRRILDLTAKWGYIFDWRTYRALSFGHVWCLRSAQESSYSGKRNIPLAHEFDQSTDHEFTPEVLFLRGILDFTANWWYFFDWRTYHALSFDKAWEMYSAQDSSYPGRRNWVTWLCYTILKWFLNHHGAPAECPETVTMYIYVKGNLGMGRFVWVSDFLSRSITTLVASKDDVARF